MRTTTVAMAMALAAALTAPAAWAGQKIAVANEGGIRGEWMLADGVQLVAPDYPPGFVARHDTVCLGMGYLLHADGTTSDFTLLKGWNSASGSAEPTDGYWSAFAEASADALKQWRFQPRPEVASPQPVYTVATFVFGSKGAPLALRSHCAIPNLAAHLRELRGSRDRRVAATPILAQLDLDSAASQSDVGFRTTP